MINQQPAPAPFSGFAASSGTGAAFGSPAAPPGGAFGAPFGSPAAAPSGSLFGTTNTNTTTFGGGQQPTTGGGLFGNPAPSAGGLFGTTTNTNNAFGGFGTATAAPGGFASPAVNPAAYQPAAFTRQTAYKDLPEQYRNQINQIVKTAHEHRKIMAQVRNSGPPELSTQVDATGRKYVPLQKTIEQAKNELEANLLPKISSLNDRVTALQAEVRSTLVSAICDAKWTTEFVANSRGIRITKLHGRTDETSNAELHAALEQQASQLSRIERLPTPFLWKALEDNHRHLSHLQELQDQIKARAGQKDWAKLPVTYLIEQQDEQLFQIRRKLKNLGVEMEQIRSQYARMETKIPNVLEEAEIKEQVRASRMAAQYRRLAAVPVDSQTNPPGTTAPATAGGVFGSSTPAPAGGLFGAPATSTAFGATPAPGGLFGSSAPAPSTAFGATPAPGGLFGSSAPAPSTGFGAAPAPGGFFGAPAPGSTGGLFGPAPSTPGTGFAMPSFPKTSGSARSGMNKNKKGGGRRG